MSLTIKRTEFRFALLNEEFLPVKVYYAKEEPSNLHGGHYRFEDLRTGRQIIFSAVNRFLIERVIYDDIEFNKYCEKKQIPVEQKTGVIDQLKKTLRGLVYLSDVISFFRFEFIEDRFDYRSITGELFVDGFLEKPE